MSRFVAAGTSEANAAEKDLEWTKVQRELEANRQRKAESGTQEGGKSLYEVLQANKVAKQDAFEESIRLKNQFRSLDDDEVDFLESVLETTRAREEQVRKETAEELDYFRKQQEEAEKSIAAPDSTVAEEVIGGEPWTTRAKKRKKIQKDKSLTGLKRRRTSSADGIGEAKAGQNVSAEKQDISTQLRNIHEVSPSADTPSKDPAQNDVGDSKKSGMTIARPENDTKLALVAYSSDDEP